jgi:transposase
LAKAALPEDVSLEQVDIWFQDESRVGQQGSRTRLWTKRGTRPRVVKQQQFLSHYIFGAVCPSQKICAAIVVPSANHEGLQKHLEEIAAHVPPGRHALIVMDQAGWHKAANLLIPKNLSILHLPPYSPELNPQEQVWQYLKDHFLANRVFRDSKEILNACCEAWNHFARMPDLIYSLTTRKWAQLI